ncbi:uncharacterized protein LOC122502403 [Leptopilina heterotoma]|uniref:uncharacterized protein LOC122502403 n=1 Tax=Leptopilina heterotoma TaxID=63436 RepID=UPI001CA7F2FD|nr:uncharacterized protein LOC122502403 [Leptopilina heterotoma]
MASRYWRPFKEQEPQHPTVETPRRTKSVIASRDSAAAGTNKTKKVSKRPREGVSPDVINPESLVEAKEASSSSPSKTYAETVLKDGADNEDGFKVVRKRRERAPRKKPPGEKKELSKHHLKLTTTEAVKITARDPKSYEGILPLIKSKVKPEDTGTVIQKIRRTFKQEVLLIVKKGGETLKFADSLFSALYGMAEVIPLVNKRSLEIKDLDEATTKSEMTSALKEKLGKSDLTMECKLLPRHRGTKQCSDRPKYYKDYIQRGSQTAIPKSTWYRYQQKFKEKQVSKIWKKLIKKRINFPNRRNFSLSLQQESQKTKKPQKEKRKRKFSDNDENLDKNKKKMLKDRSRIVSCSSSSSSNFSENDNEDSSEKSNSSSNESGSLVSIQEGGRRKIKKISHRSSMIQKNSKKTKSRQTFKPSSSQVHEEGETSGARGNSLETNNRREDTESSNNSTRRSELQIPRRKFPTEIFVSNMKPIGSVDLSINVYVGSHNDEEYTIYEDTWELMLSKNDSQFTRDMAEHLWGKEVLFSRCMQKCYKNPEVPFLTPQKYKLVKDALFYKITKNQGNKLNVAARAVRVKKIWKYMSAKISDCKRGDRNNRSETQ